MFILTRAEIHNDKEMVLVSGQLLKFLLCSTEVHFLTQCVLNLLFSSSLQYMLYLTFKLACVFAKLAGAECYFPCNVHVLSS